jgi:membrane-bound ClpP family serine protease
MKQNKRNISSVFLLIGMLFLAADIVTGNNAFSWAAVVFVLLSLIFGGRWLRPRKKRP